MCPKRVVSHNLEFQGLVRPLRCLADDFRFGGSLGILPACKILDQFVLTRGLWPRSFSTADGVGSEQSTHVRLRRPRRRRWASSGFENQGSLEYRNRSRCDRQIKSGFAEKHGQVSRHQVDVERRTFFGGWASGCLGRRSTYHFERSPSGGRAWHRDAFEPLDP